MDKVIKEIDIDLYSHAPYEIIKAQQGDNKTRIIELTLYDKGEIYTIPNGVILKLEGHRGDKTSFVKENCTVSNNKITVILDNDILYAPGIVEATIVMYDISNDNILSTIPFRIHVQKNPCDKNKLEYDKKSLIDDIILSIEKMKQNFAEHINNFLNPHKVTKTQVGLGNADNTADIDKNVNSAKKLTTARNINGTSFNGTSDITTDKWGKSRTLKLSGDVSASKVIDGSTDVDINVEVKDNSHRHTVSNISDLTATASELNCVDGVTSNIQTQLDTKAPIASPILTGTPKAPTAIAGTNSTQIATTAFTQTVVSNHNTSSSSHSDIRGLITGLTTRLNALADSDDTTLDQLSEIVAYIKSNRSLIENVTTSKVSVSDIVDNLTSTVTNKPLSAKQGKIVKDLIDALTTIVGNKVDKVLGKGLSTNDYTTNEKTKLAGIASGAEVNVQSDWNVTDTGSDSFIKNKPTSLPANGGNADTVGNKHVSDFLSSSGGIVTGSLIPANDATKSLGAFGLRWCYGYFQKVLGDEFATYNDSLPMVKFQTSAYVVYSSTGSATFEKAIIFGVGSISSIYQAYRINLSSQDVIMSNKPIYTYSDEKVKIFTNDIEEDKDALIKLFDLINLKSYKHRQSKNKSLTIGLSAQELELACEELDINPEKYNLLNIDYRYMLPRGDGEEDYKYYTKFYSISYNDLYNLSLLKIKSIEEEHYKKIEDANKKFTELKDKYSDLERRLLALENN